MASQARKNFDENCQDIERLLEIHEDLGGAAQGRRFQLEVLNKSAVVLICAVWEAYCEDLVAEAIEHLVTHAGASSLSKDVKKVVAKDIRSDKNELAAWELAGDGWKDVLSDRLADMQEERNRKLNTPKSGQIKELFSTHLGISDITSKWYWSGMAVRSAKRKLDEYVELRGAIAHRGTADTAVKKAQVVAFLNHIKKLVAKTGGSVNAFVKKSTDQVGLW